MQLFLMLAPNFSGSINQPLSNSICHLENSKIDDSTLVSYECNHTLAVGDSMNEGVQVCSAGTMFVKVY